MKTTKLIRSLVALIGVAFATNLYAQTTALTYQGRLAENGQAASGTYDLRFILYTADTGGNQVGPILTNGATSVLGGLFTVPLDFGTNVFTGPERWLDIAVRTNGVAANFTPLNPRQPITSAPYAIYSGRAMMLAGALPDLQLAGTYSSPVTLNNAGNSFTGDGAGLTGVDAATLGGLDSSNFWQVNGNSGTTAGATFIGTTASQPVEIKVHGLRAIRIEDNGDSGDPDATSDGAPNLIGGSPYNFVGAGVVGATIGGGGATNFMGSSAYTNSVWSDFGVVGGGYGNRIEANSRSSVIGGGFANDIQPNSFHATIGGGQYNHLGTNSTWSVIGGGYNNGIRTNTDLATIAGGDFNHIGTDSDFGTIGGGSDNFILDSAEFATIPGGDQNTAAGNYSFAAGYRAQANHDGAFVWADHSASTYVASQRANQFRVRADGGVRFDINNGHWIDLRRFSNLVTPDRIINTSSGAYLSTGGTWVNSSDVARKENFQTVDGGDVLAALAALPISQWNYKGENGAPPHLGPSAQDFHAAFRLGADDKHIATVDADGVALAAIQGLNQKVESEKRKAETRMEKLEVANSELKARLEMIEQRLNQRLNGGSR